MPIRRAPLFAACFFLPWVVADAQQPPRPFPQPSAPRQGAPRNNSPAMPVEPVPPTVTPGRPSAGAPDERTLGVPIYPTAQFLRSYDAGRGQRFYLFGVTLPYAEVVTYYRTALKTRGEVLFETPPTHHFEIARFREETMAFPPSVTIKDYTWGGSGGFPNPKRDAQPARFATVVQIVPPPGVTPQ